MSGSAIATWDWPLVSFDVDNEDGFHYNAISEIKDAGLFLVGELGTMYRSADYGESWETLQDLPYDGSLFGITGTGEANGVIALGLRGNVFRSEDFGDTWTQVSLKNAAGGEVSSTLSGGQLSADGRVVLTGVGGVVAVSDDAGRSFTVNVRPDRAALATGLSLSDGSTVLVGQRGIIKADKNGMSAGSKDEVLPEVAGE